MGKTKMNKKTRAIIVDLDGTLANCDHRRHFVDGTHEKQDWRSFYESMRTDTINEWCKQIAQKFNPVFVSGRPEEYRDITIDWLDKNGFYKSISSVTFYENGRKPEIKKIPKEWPLFMRKTADYRDDTVIKEEIYREHIEPYYNILFAIDDRSKIAALWRRLGIVCLHCAEGDF
jgi:predicted secreted acid phosphatase